MPVSPWLKSTGTSVPLTHKEYELLNGTPVTVFLPSEMTGLASACTPVCGALALIAAANAKPLAEGSLLVAMVFE